MKHGAPCSAIELALAGMLCLYAAAELLAMRLEPQFVLKRSVPEW